MNMLATIVPKSDQINADDLIGGPLTITVREVKFSGGQEQPVSMYFDGSDKAYRPCKSMCRVLVAAWGPDAKEYVGRSMTLYRDPSVKWGGLEVGGIRISHMTHIPNAMTMALTATKGSRKPFTVKPLANVPAAQPAGVGAVSAETMLAGIAACTSQADLRKWWTANNEQIPDAGVDPAYDAVVEAFNQRLVAVKQPARPSSGDDGSAAEQAGPTPPPATEEAPAQQGGKTLQEKMQEVADSTKQPDASIIPALSLEAVKAELDRKEFVTDIKTYLTTLRGQISDADLGVAEEYGFARISEMEAA